MIERTEATLWLTSGWVNVMRDIDGQIYSNRPLDESELNEVKELLKHHGYST